MPTFVQRAAVGPGALQMTFRSARCATSGRRSGVGRYGAGLQAFEVWVEPPGQDPPWVDLDDLVAQPRLGRVDVRQRVGGATDLDSPYLPRVDRSDVVDNQRDDAGRRDIAELPGGAEVVAVDLDDAVRADLKA